MNSKMSEHTLWYQKPADNFNEALPLGNGRIGACVYGRTDNETISLNEDTLWSGYPKEIAKENFPDIYKKAVSLCEEGRVKEAQKLLEDKFGDYLVQMYLPLGRLRIDMKHTGEINGYKRELRIDRAVHKVVYDIQGREYIRECFVSHDAQVVVIHFNCSQPAGISFSAWLESDLKCKYEITDNIMCMEGHAPNCFAPYRDSYKSTDYQIYAESPAEKGMGFAAMLGVDVSGGLIENDGGKLSITNADEVTLYVAARTAFEGWNKHPSGSKVDYKKECLSDLSKACKFSYHQLLKQHLASHGKLYDRCGISLNSSSNSGKPTDKRMELLAAGEEDNALYALLFNYGRYLAISASREGTQPMNLQGIWNEKLLPPWNSNYTLNINTEMNYWPLLVCGLPECYTPLIRMTQELAESGGVTARVYYDADGWVCHHSTDIWRLTHPGTNRLPGNAQWGFWNMASGWLAVMLWDYYRYTGDKIYLKNIYPVMEGAALFYRQLLTEKEGKLILSPSTSPENNYIQNGEVHAIDHSTAMTQEILYDIFSAVSQTQQILGLEDQYAELLPRLKKPQVQKDGLLCEWDEEHEVWDMHHRHLSHLYGLFPSNQFDEEQKKAAGKVLEQRGDGGTGWSLAWKINLWARLGDGERALKLLNHQLRPVPGNCDSTEHTGGSYPNLLCAHPPFQIDGNFGAANGIVEMLVQTDCNGNPVLLPALPESWKEGKVRGICLPGGKKVSFGWSDGKITDAYFE